MQKITVFNWLWIGFLLSLSLGVYASQLDKVSVSDAYVRASIPGTSITSAYMTLKNNSENKVE